MVIAHRANAVAFPPHSGGVCADAEMRPHLSPTCHARAQVSTLREHFLKLGAQVIVTVRRIVLHLPQAFPDRDSFHRLALSLAAQTG
jgi:hypothetical protein